MQGANEKKKLSCCNRNIFPLMKNNKSMITMEAQPLKKKPNEPHKEHKNMEALGYPKRNPSSLFYFLPFHFF